MCFPGFDDILPCCTAETDALLITDTLSAAIASHSQVWSSSGEVIGWRGPTMLRSSVRREEFNVDERRTVR